MESALFIVNFVDECSYLVNLDPDLVSIIKVYSRRSEIPNPAWGSGQNDCSGFKGSSLRKVRYQLIDPKD